MKYIFNLTALMVLFVILSSSILEAPQKTTSLVLRSSERNVSSDLIDKSVNIISSRLKIYGLQSFSVKASAANGQIQIMLDGNVDLSEIEGLLVSRGELAFYETNNSSNFEEMLKNNKAGKPILTASDVESVISASDTDGQSIRTQIKFKPASAKTWAEATRRNLDKPIAVVIDNTVFYTPVVRSVIEGGACEISGNMSQKETSYFVALVNNKPLPITLKLVR